MSIATLAHIARKAGVSKATVSVVLNDRLSPVRISEKTRRTVLAVAAELDYRPNVLARGLAGGRTHTLGVVSTLASFSQYLAIGRELSKRARQRGYATSFADTLGDPDLTGQILDDLAHRRTDGVVLELRIGDPVNDALRARLEPFAAAVALTARKEQLGADQIVRDRLEAFREVADHFGATGRVRPAILIPGADTDPKVHAFVKRLDGHGVRVDRRNIINFVWPGAGRPAMEVAFRALTARVSSDGPLPDALLCTGDRAAVAAMNLLQSKGLRIPDDLALVGVGGDPIGPILATPLATIDRQDEEMTDIVERMLFGRLDDPKHDPECEYVPWKFIWRESAG